MSLPFDFITVERSEPAKTPIRLESLQGQFLVEGTIQLQNCQRLLITKMHDDDDDDESIESIDDIMEDNLQDLDQFCMSNNMFA
jgi:hypothetical protein